MVAWLLIVLIICWSMLQFRLGYMLYECRLVAFVLYSVDFHFLLTHRKKKWKKKKIGKQAHYRAFILYYYYIQQFFYLIHFNPLGKIKFNVCLYYIIHTYIPIIIFSVVAIRLIYTYIHTHIYNFLPITNCTFIFNLQI